MNSFSQTMDAILDQWAADQPRDYTPPPTLDAQSLHPRVVEKFLPRLQATSGQQHSQQGQPLEGGGDLRVVSKQPSLGGMVLWQICTASQNVGLIIGRGGETLKAIENQTHTRVTCDQPGARERVVTIQGREENVRRAVEWIERRLVEHRQRGPGGGNGAASSGKPSVVLQVPVDQVGALIGRRGDTIRWLESESGARVEIEQSAPGQVTRQVTLSGEERALGKVRELVQQLLDQQQQQGGGGF